MPPSSIPGVGEVTRYLRMLVDQDPRLADLWVTGEVSNLSQHSSGHIYFTLKEGGAALRCAFFRGRNQGQRNRLTDGAAVAIHGSLSVYEPRGELSLLVDFVQPAGVGALTAEFERRRAAYAAEGLFAAERKRPLPAFPRTIGVVTSPTGAVLHDISDVLARRWPLASLLVQPSPVQGAAAAPAVAHAVRVIGEHRPDVVIVARGGGSAEDLWAFNEEPVVRAIFASPVPVVSAVGHETDVTLADLVADVRAPTPSAAAELVAPDRGDLGHRVEAMRRRSDRCVDRQIDDATRDVDRQIQRLGRLAPDTAFARQAIHERMRSLEQQVHASIERRSGQIDAMRGRLVALSPRSTLQRGYALVERPGGAPVTRASALIADDPIIVHLQDGSRHARIIEEAS